jgi:hypothetical protein
LISIEICTVDLGAIQQVLDLKLTNFNDVVQIASAMRASLDVIVTRDLSGFVGSAILFMSPDELLKELN